MADKTACTVAGCEKARRYSNGLCPMHYQRLRNHGDLTRTRQPQKPRVRRVGVEPCEIEGCDKPMRARGWCTAHWTRWKRHGSPTVQRPGEVVDGKRICPTCHRVVALIDWYVRPNDGKFTRCNDCFGEWNRARANRRRSGVDGDYFTRADVIARDGWTCGICDQAIDQTLRHPNPLSVTLDHVVPLARGGAHTMANSQVAHRICNQRKWAHMPAARVG